MTDKDRAAETSCTSSILQTTDTAQRIYSYSCSCSYQIIKYSLFYSPKTDVVETY